MTRYNKLKKGEVIPLTFNKMFKKVFADPNDTDLVKYLIKQIIGIEVEDVTIYNNELLGDNYNNKKQEVDLLLKADEVVVNFELNSKYNKTIINRNVLYVCRLLSNELVPSENYLNLSKHYQVNLNINEKKKNPFRIYQLINTDDINDRLTDLISIYEIDISYYMHL